MHVGVGIAHFIARRAVADDEQEHILGGSARRAGLTIGRKQTRRFRLLEGSLPAFEQSGVGP